MNREITLKEWPMTVLGGPVLKNTMDAIMYGSISYDKPEYTTKLKKQLEALKSLYLIITQNEITDLDLKADIAFRTQFCRDAMRQIVKMRFNKMINQNKPRYFDDLCPFCNIVLVEHGDFGDCPGEED